MKKIQTILIDPCDQSISYIDISNSVIQDYYEAMQCSCFDVIRLGDGVIMYIDDEGLLKDNMYFRLGSHNFAGRCIIANETDDGGTTDCHWTIDQVVKKIEWLPEGHKEEPFMQFVSLD
jgi:hypothetical protein|tara:strand:+ start:461 stop:817 length:357 start_codon:yes stop_codon:yes gene_type:complete